MTAVLANPVCSGNQIILLKQIAKHFVKTSWLQSGVVLDLQCKWQEDNFFFFLRVWRVFQSKATSLVAEMNFPLEEKKSTYNKYYPG